MQIMKSASMTKDIACETQEQHFLLRFWIRLCMQANKTYRYYEGE
jgi:hypothetical protein